MNTEKIIEELREIQEQIQEVVDAASIDIDTCFHEKPDYIISWEHIQTLNKIIGRGDDIQHKKQ